MSPCQHCGDTHYETYDYRECAEKTIAAAKLELEEAEKQYRAKALGELWTRLPENIVGYHMIVGIVQDSLTAALSRLTPPAEKKRCPHGCASTNCPHDAALNAQEKK